MKKMLVGLLSTTLLLSACAGKTPHPVPQHQEGDEILSCSRIKQELMDNQTKIMALIPQQNKTTKNVILGAAGAVLFVPWFFMDFSDAERIEVEAYQLRDNWLRTLAEKKKCGSIPGKIKFQDQ